MPVPITQCQAGELATNDSFCTGALLPGLSQR
jgi:hypothetical protein